LIYSTSTVRIRDSIQQTVDNIPEWEGSVDFSYRSEALETEAPYSKKEAAGSFSGTLTVLGRSHGLRVVQGESINAVEHGTTLHPILKGAAALRLRTGEFGAQDGSELESPNPPEWFDFESTTRATSQSIMILPQVHLRKPCYDFYFL
jgi:hypothetical protein